MKIHKNAKIRNYLLLFFGVFLLLDGILSVVVSTAPDCLSTCLNNSVPGQIGRIARALIGAFLIYESFQRRRVI